MPIAPWLRQHLIDTGAWNGDNVHRTARIQTHACGLLVITGLDNDTVAGPATCDPLPLTPLGEAQALLAGRTTYDHDTLNHRLYRRTSYEISGRPAGTDRWSNVVADHICGSMPLDHVLPVAIAKEIHDEPPF